MSFGFRGRQVNWDMIDTMMDESALFSVTMPKMMLVQNRRLGAILRILQVTTLVSMVWYGLFMGGCYVTYMPVGHQQGLWFLPSESSGGSLTGQHCSHPTSYWHSFGEFISARPTGCRNLPAEAAFYDFTSHVQGEAGIFFPTYVQDDTTTYGPENACNDMRSQGCSTLTTRDEFFMANPGEQLVSIFHGFKVGPGEATGGWEVRDSSTKDTLLTVIVRTDGSRCTVAGKSEWSVAEARAGISGRLMDWLDCAGVSLDTDPRTLAPANDVGLAPHLRTMGFSMQLGLEYKSQGDVNLCTMRVSVIPAWTVRKQTDLVELPAGLNNQTILRVRTSTGVAVSLKVTGKFKHFDSVRALRFFCDSVVLLQLPMLLVRFLTLFALGSLSSVYRRARMSRVDVYHDFHVAFAKMMIAIVGFRGIMGGIWTGQARELPGLTRPCMLHQLTDVFEEPLRKGQLEMDELHRMVALVFRHLDRDGTGEIGLSEFVHSFVAHDAIKIEDAVRFFSAERGQQKWHHRVLDDSQRRRRDSLRTLSGGSSEAELRAVAAAVAHDCTKQQKDHVSFESPADSSEATPVDDPNIAEPVDQESITGKGTIPDKETDRGMKRDVNASVDLGVLDTSGNTWVDTMRGAFSEATSKDWSIAELWTPLTALQNTVADIERRLEKLEIKNMEDQFRTWTPNRRESYEKGHPEENEACMSSHKGFGIPMIEVGTVELAPQAPAEPDRELHSLGALLSRRSLRSPRSRAPGLPSSRSARSRAQGLPRPPGATPHAVLVPPVREREEPYKSRSQEPYMSRSRRSFLASPRRYPPLSSIHNVTSC